MIARRIIEAAINRGAGPDVVQVEELGTVDAFTAIYVDGNLVVENPRMDIANLLAALNIVPRVLHVPKGFGGQFPPKLSQLRLA